MLCDLALQPFDGLIDPSHQVHERLGLGMLSGFFLQTHFFGELIAFGSQSLHSP